MLLVTIYLLICVIVSLFAKNTRAGVLGFFIISMIFTPLLASIILFATTPRENNQ